MTCIKPFHALIGNGVAIYQITVSYIDREYYATDCDWLIDWLIDVCGQWAQTSNYHLTRRSRDVGLYTLAHTYNGMHHPSLKMCHFNAPVCHPRFRAAPPPPPRPIKRPGRAKKRAPRTKGVETAPSETRSYPEHVYQRGGLKTISAIKFFIYAPLDTRGVQPVFKGVLLVGAGAILHTTFRNIVSRAAPPPLKRAPQVGGVALPYNVFCNMLL